MSVGVASSGAWRGNMHVASVYLHDSGIGARASFWPVAFMDLVWVGNGVVVCMAKCFMMRFSFSRGEYGSCSG